MATVVRRFGRRYVARYPGIPYPHLKAMQAIAACRTPALGAHEVRCGSCGVTEIVNSSCRNRACPRCSAQKNQEWVDRHKAEVLPVQSYQVVFTVPREVGRFVRQHPAIAYNAMMKAAAQTIMEVVGKRHGGLAALMLVLHTWTRMLTYHPHVHCIVPAVVLTDEGKLKHINEYLASSKQLAPVFRQKLFALLRAEVDVPQELGSTFHTDWVVNVGKSRGATGEQVIEYLGRYINRVALGDHRIVEVTETHVTFKYKSEDRKKWLTMTLPAHEFLRRYLQHVLPKGFHKVRHYGLWSSAYRDKRLKLRAQLLAGLPGDIHAPMPTGYAPEPPKPKVLADFILHCPYCEQDARYISRRLTPAQAMALAAEDAPTEARPPP